MSDETADDEREPRRADKAKPAADTTTTERTGPVQFLREVRSELRKVAWPSRKELVSYTIVVLTVSAVLTALVWGFDVIIRDAIINTLG